MEETGNLEERIGCYVWTAAHPVALGGWIFGTFWHYLKWEKGQSRG